MSNDGPIYKSVRQALRWAFYSEVAVVLGTVPTVPYYAKPETDGPDGPQIGDMLVGSAMQERASHVPDPREHAARFERIAEGAWTLALVRDTLDDDLMAVIDARYTHPDTPALATRKYSAIVKVAQMIHKLGTYGAPTLDYAIAAAAEYCGHAPPNPKEWTEYLRVTERTLRNWRHGREPWDVGIAARMRVFHAEAERKLEGPLAARGLVFREDEPICDNKGKGKEKGSASWSGLLTLRWRKPSNDRRTGEHAADVLGHRDESKARYRRARLRCSCGDAECSSCVRVKTKSDGEVSRGDIHQP